jgi:hypothetical protein
MRLIKYLRRLWKRKKRRSRTLLVMGPVMVITGPCSYCGVAGRLRFENIIDEVLLKAIKKGVLGVWRDFGVCHVRHCTGQYTA